VKSNILGHRRLQLISFYICFVFVSLCATNTAMAQQNDTSDATYSEEIEATLNNLFRDLREHQLVSAAIKSEQLTRDFPDFALGQLLHAELMATQALEPMLMDSQQAYSPALLELMMEAQSRSRQSTLTLDDTRLPDSLLHIGKNIEHIVTVDLEFSRLYLVRNNGNKPRIVSHHYAASGRGGYGKSFEGDLRTPTGVYQVTEFKPDSILPDLYGAGALTLDYPNALDRHYKRTGSGIWLHGIPSEDLSRAPRSSEGCVVMPNDLLRNLRDTVDINKTLVVLSGQLGWQSRQELQNQSLPFIELFERWRSAWLRNDQHELVALHMPPLFQKASLGVPSFAKLFSAKDSDIEKLAEVSIDDLTIIRYPLFPNGQPNTRVKTPEGAQVMMQFAIPGLKRRITLYWEQLIDKKWHVVQIKHDSNLI